MNKKENYSDEQFYYLGRWVNKSQFKAFVYNEKDESKLANSYDEFESLVSSGLWFSEKPKVEISLPQGKRKKHNDIVCPTS